MTAESTGAAGAESLFARLLMLSREAHAARQHEAAYHALAAATHAAHDAHDLRALAAVIREAEAQIEWIDRHDPSQRLSTSSAGEHAHPGVYAMLVRQAAAYMKMERPFPGAAPPGGTDHPAPRDATS